MMPRSGSSRRHSAGLDASTPIQSPIRSAQIPIDERGTRGAQSFRGFLPWRLPDAGPSASRCVGLAGIRNPCMGRCLSSKFLHGLISLFDQAGDHLLVRRPDPYWPSLFAPAGSVGGRIVLPCGAAGDKSEGSSPSGAEIAPRPCIRSIRGDRNHDAVMRIGGEAPGRRAHSSQRLGSHGLSSGHHHLGSSSAAPRMGRQGGYPLSSFVHSLMTPDVRRRPAAPRRSQQDARRR